jgi:hypothetical protein
MYDEVDLGILEEFLTKKLGDFEELQGMCWNILRERKLRLKMVHNTR